MDCRKSFALPSAPPTRSSVFPGRTAMAFCPPLRTPGVCVVTLPTNLSVATSVCFTVLSRLTEKTALPSAEKMVPRTQSLCPAMKTSGIPLKAFITRTALSLAPNATDLPSGDQETP